MGAAGGRHEFLAAVVLSTLLAALPAYSRHILQGTHEEGGHAPIEIASTSRPAYVHRPVPHGYEYEGNVTFIGKLASGPIPLIHARRDTALPAQAAAPATHRTVLITRDGRRFAKTLTLNSRHDGVFGEPRLPSGQAPDQAQPEASPEMSTEGRSLLQTGMVNTNTFNCVGCPAGGPDTRTLVQDTSAFPYSAVGQLMGQVTTNTALECTGTLIGTRHVLTAGHCVYDIHTTHKMVSSLDFAPGMNGHGRPNGVVQWQNVRILSQFQSQSTYSTTAINYDFALITLISDVPSSLGYFGVQRGSGDVTYNIASAGYPADKTTGSMWQTTCNNVEYDFGENQGVFKDVSQCVNNACANILQHTCVASEGQSGAGMWDTTSRKIHSILTGKLSTTEGNSYYVGTKMDAFVYDTLNAWYQEDMNSGMPTEDNTGSGSSGTPPTTVGMGGASAASSAPSTPPTRATGGGAGSFPGLGGGAPPATASTASSTPSSPSPPLGGLFGGLLNGFAAAIGTAPAAADATTAPAPAPTAVVDTQPTGALSALLTTSDGISLVFDPLIRKPTQVAADIVQNIAQGVSGGRR